MARFGKIGWFFGLVMGSLIGILFAPGKGKNLRERIKAARKKGELGVAPLQDDLKQIVSDIADVAKDVCDSATVSELIEKGKKKLKDITENAKADIAVLPHEGEHGFEKHPLKKMRSRRKPKASSELKREKE